ncbi:response regulator transcription factor [Flagellimonas zhangzhouensis]|uniref:Two-component system, OmpR family, alkaline phosphatase synthesis response regulator PhoP n=1 Tax=Flagellimonas zhangzhouensis TaxID=1073328 RepID=A0A1H2YDE3_9FLAO|nr:response regulator transcription factor [Allomuricauda zhangzhouensis]SDQ96798.1 two-component system, OmpR family, alkaline phosphatase synthesis response regulator PhoP [Allomuricauda zhangzhouensis]SDX03177.1 two-component system, OmpR family, alkaline phosphatase synthesis response regulator PhoP [Allomuricauda zhangzhouensis]
MKKNETKILLVDDDAEILDLLSDILASEGYIVYTAKNGREGLINAKLLRPHLIILDVMMPEMDGIETCYEIRNSKILKNTLVAFLTARGENYSEAAGLDVGADDYITKPIKPKVLISRINALLRRLQNGSKTVMLPPQKIITCGNIVINREKFLVYKDEEEIDLPHKEFELLFLLASEPEKVFSREEILKKVWENDLTLKGRTIDVHITKLRQKIGENHFKTRKGVGYKFVE